MKFDKLVLVHTLGYQVENIIVDAAPKIDAYIKYRLDKEEYIFSLIKDHPSISKDDLKELLNNGKDLSDPLRKALCLTTFNSHIRKLLNEGRVILTPRNELYSLHKCK